MGSQWIRKPSTLRKIQELMPSDEWTARFAKTGLGNGYAIVYGETPLGEKLIGVVGYKNAEPWTSEGKEWRQIIEDGKRHIIH